MAGFRVEDMSFPAVSRQDWRQLASRALKGEPFETLVSTSEDGFDFGPLYERSQNASPIAGAAERGAWRIIQIVDDPDPERANLQALEDLENGADGLSLVFAGSGSAGGFGLPPRPDAIRRALRGVKLGMVHTRIETFADSAAVVEALRALAREQDEDFAGLDLALGLNVFAGKDGSGAVATTEAARVAADLASELIRDGFQGQALLADGRPFHDAGATDAQELGAALANALHHLRALDDRGLSISSAAAAIGFALSANQKQFEQIAKLRAVRLLWGRLLELCGVADPHPARLHVQTSRRMLTEKDPHTNILRTTIAAFAAGTGGADTIAALPHTLAHGLAEPQARRLCRNTQIILLEECGLARVADPSCGSGGVEALTDSLAKAAWEEFGRIESEGGFMASLDAGALQSRVLVAEQARRARVMDGGEPIVGLTHFPLGQERGVDVLAARDHEPGPTGESPPDARALRPRRLSSEVEDAR